MKILSFFSIFMVFLFSCGCEKEKDVVKKQVDDKGVVVAIPFIWKAKLHQKSSEANGYINNSVVYNDNIVIPTTNGEKGRYISLLDTKTGKYLWHWEDMYEQGYYKNMVSFHYQYKNLLTYQNGGRSYCIDLDNGNTKWRHKRDRSFDVRIDSYDNFYFTYGDIKIDGNLEQIAYKGDIETGIISEFLTPNFTYECDDCRKAVLHITQVPNNDNLLLVTYFENLPDWITQLYFGLYDTETEKWVWDKVMLLDATRNFATYYTPIIANNKIYAEVSNYIVCHDLETGRQLWKRDFGGDFMFTGIIVEDGRVIGNCEDTYMYALNAETGNRLWRVPTAGTSSRMSYLNGVVYMVGGSGGGRLFAIEAATGKMLWRIDAGLLGEGSGARFRTNAVYVLPAKGNQPAKVIALSNMYAYCFEAER
ncbi:MAG: PQQ-binding-like beta-propeller repeat protein [Prevotellaceae bacterium]|jgi:outer membrane protein assembly factor BamB|nr:PQQ-binding-like beta-propeller repeat protein [Prevotellaceae bacterium]